MAGTYKATGINLKGMPMGESDRLLTILTKEYGLIRAVAPGARKHQSSLRGRSGLFVVNELLIAKGRSLDKIVQADSLESHPSLSQDLRKLTASQYLAELVLCQALSDQPQEDLFNLLNNQLALLEKLPGGAVLASLVHTTFHLLTLAGVSPQVHACCITQQPLVPDFTDLDWRTGFSAAAGGTVKFSELAQSRRNEQQPFSTINSLSSQTRSFANQKGKVVEGTISARVADRFHSHRDFSVPLNAIQLALLQRLAQPDLIQPDGTLFLPPGQNFPQYPSHQIWLSVERVLRHYAEYHFECPIRSATLIDTCFLSVPQISS